MPTLFWTMGSSVAQINRSKSTGVYILCGGASSRMGQCKGTVEIQGRPMIKHILDTLSPLPSPVFLVGKPEQQTILNQYGQEWVSDRNVTYHPLNGVVAGLEHAIGNFEQTLFLPCDTPFVSVRSIERLLQNCPSVAIDPLGEIHPLMLHIPVSWIERARQFLRDERSMKSFAEPSRLVTLSHNCLRNLNRPSDLPHPIR